MEDKLEIEYVGINEVEPWDKNPKEHDMAGLTNSVETFGPRQPILVQKGTNRIIAGHGRLKAYRERGMDKIPVMAWDCTDEEADAYAIADNQLTIALGWDEDELSNILKEVDDDFIDSLGFSESELMDLLGEEMEVEEDDFEEPDEIETDIERGDVFQLGDHRLMCGDATSEGDVEVLMDGKEADMVFTDPPYGMNLDTDFSDMEGIAGGNKYKKVEGDDKKYNPNHIFDTFNTNELFLWGADYYAELIPNRNEGCFFVWDKTEGGVRTNSTYDKMFGSNFELCWSKQKHKRQIVRALWKGIFGLSEEDTKKRLHPTQKPVKLCSWFIEKFSDKADKIVDVFGGSGSTLIASEQLDRRCYMMEIDPQYCQVIIDRWEDFTGDQADKLT